VARDPALLDRIRAARSHCLSSSTWDRLRSGDADYDVSGIGLNYRPTEIASAIGRIQLGKLARDRRRRGVLTAAYRERLAAVPGLVAPFAHYDGDSARHLMAVLLPHGVDRNEVRSELRHRGIQTSVHYRPTHHFTLYRERFGSRRHRLPVTEALAPRLLSLPLHALMSDDDVALVVDGLSDSIRSAERSLP
jgi:dTDP-4-amino-4,6-dideoxygalactose transaminase